MALKPSFNLTFHFYKGFTMNKSLFALLILAAIIFWAPDAFAEPTGGGGLPFDSWLTNLKTSITGPFAFTAAIIGIIAAGATLIFGGDLNGFFRSMLFIVLVIALIVAANNLLTGFFGASALVPETLQAPQG